MTLYLSVWFHTGLAHVAMQYRIVGNFRGRKLLQIGRKGAFRGENIHGMLN